MATLVFGLDGGNWDLVEPWLDEGRLPNFKRLRNEGTWCISRSVLPPVTCPNWKCYASSRSPDHHGVYWWEHVDRKTLNVDVPDSRSFTAPEIWDYVNDEGLSTGIMNLPMSYPPRNLDGFMIAGGPRSGEQDYTSPPELEGRLEKEFGYRVHPEKVVTSEEDEAGVEATLDLIKKRFEVAHHLLKTEDLDFLHVTIFHLNVLQHYFYNDIPTRRAWELIDEQLGQFLDEGHTIFLMSDHGCSEIETVFYVNEWLEKNGFLKTTTTNADYLMKFGVTQARLAKLVRTIGLESTIRKYLPRRLIERFPDEEGIKRDQKFDKVITDESDAIASGQGLIYVLDDPNSREYEKTVTRLVESLSELKTPRGTPLATTVHRGNDYYPEGNPRYRPDVVFDQGPGVHTSGALGEKVLFSDPGKWRAENVTEGLFLAHGPDIPSVKEIDPISILDIAPTVLQKMGLAVPSNFEGESVDEVVQDNEAKVRDPLPARGEKNAKDSNAVQERLSDLGYIE